MSTSIGNQPGGIIPQPPIEGGGEQQTPAIDAFFGTLLKSLEELSGTSGTGAASESKGTSSSQDLIVGESLDEEGTTSSNDIEDPNLLGPDTDLVTNFNNRLAQVLSASKTLDGLLPCGTNSWFTPGGAFTLFVILSSMASIMAKMAREESLVDIALTNVQMTMAKEISNLILSQGEVAAQKLMTDAMKSMTEGIVAIGQIVMSAVSVMYTEGTVEKEKEKFITNKKQEILSNSSDPRMQALNHEADLEAIGPPPGRKGADFDNARSEWIRKNQDDELNRLAQPSSKDLLKIRSNVSQVQVATFKEVYNGMFTAVKSFTSASLDVQKAQLEREQAMMDSTRTLIDKLFEIISKTERKVDSDTDGMRKSVQDILSKLREIIQLQGKFWSGQA